MKSTTSIVFTVPVVVITIAYATGSHGRSAHQESRYLSLAEGYAPVIYQETKSVQLDALTRFDYDCDWNGANNWRNAYLYSHPPSVYYAVVESENYYFITYAFFHARDWTAHPIEGFAPKVEHENDMEGCQLLIAKNSGSFGNLWAMETLAHDRFYLYLPRDRLDLAGSKRVAGTLLTKGNGHQPCVHIEPEGHGVFGQTDASFAFSPQKPGIVYQYQPGIYPSDTPRPMETGVGYRLLSIEDELWSRRYQIGDQQTYCCA